MNEKEKFEAFLFDYWIGVLQQNRINYYEDCV